MFLVWRRVMNSNLAVMPEPKKEHKKKARRVRGQGYMFQRGMTWWFELVWKGQRYRESLGTAVRLDAVRKFNARVAEIHSGELPKTFEPISVQAMYDLWITE